MQDFLSSVRLNSSDTSKHSEMPVIHSPQGCRKKKKAQNIKIKKHVLQFTLLKSEARKFYNGSVLLAVNSILVEIWPKRELDLTAFLFEFFDLHAPYMGHKSKKKITSA